MNFQHNDMQFMCEERMQAEYVEECHWNDSGYCIDAPELIPAGYTTPARGWLLKGGIRIETVSRE